ncbi:MAG TPA: hypothetical protein VNG71_00095 [Pyrinomonadaceae bacterium]|nr:hypothetical protein [Pyrinomonadaceae bacterium]
MRLGISGHQDISREVAAYVRPILIRLVNEQKDNVVGVSSLAAGADQLFATVILEHGGSVHSIIPSHGYERTFKDPESLDQFKSLLARAQKIETLDYPEPSEEAFLDAGRHVVDNSDLLIAVWDGQPAAGKGGTADIVDYARRRGVEMIVVWPPGVSR